MNDSCIMDQQTMLEFKEFDGRLTQLEGRMGAVEDILSKHGNLLIEIKSAVTEERASRGPATSEIIRTISSIATTFAIIASLLVYVATSVMSAPITAANERHYNLEHRFSRMENLDVNMALLEQRTLAIEKRLDTREFVHGWDTHLVMNEPPPLRR